MTATPMTAAMVALLALSACDDRPCLEWETQQVLTYPFLGMMQVNLPLAMTPVWVENRVCIKRDGSSPTPTGRAEP